MKKEKYIRIPWIIFFVVIALFFANMIHNNHQRELDRQIERKKMEASNQQRELNRQLDSQQRELDRQLKRELANRKNPED